MQKKYHIIFEAKYRRKIAYGKLKYKYGNRHFWCRGYYVDTVGKKCEEDTRVYRPIYG